MPKAKPLILLFCWLTVAMVTGVAIGLYPAFNIEIEPLNDIKELQCHTVITKELELIDESEQIHAGLCLDANGLPVLYMNGIPDGPMLDCLPNDIIIKNDKRIYWLMANNKGKSLNGLSFITVNKQFVNAVIGVDAKGDLCFGLSGENKSLVSGIGLLSNDPAMEILQTKDPGKLLSINYYPPAGSGIYLKYPDQMLTFPYKKDNTAKPSRIFQSLLGK